MPTLRDSEGDSLVGEDGVEGTGTGANEALQFFDAGFFPKEAYMAQGWLEERAGKGTRICSVSRCISDGPAGWIQHWKHNGLGMFDSPELARTVIAQEDSQHYEIHGYRVATVAFEEGQPVAGALRQPSAGDIPEGAALLGYDAVGKDLADFPECSPLSCNGGAEEFETNEWCLLATPEEAAKAAARFSSEDWEPGNYYVVEVWRIGPPATPRPSGEPEA